MRVIAGSRKSLQLQTPPGMDTRPTTDRIKETLFNMIGHDICDAVFLDMFAGSGQMGIEALSRGARKAYFIEKDKRALSCIRSNLTHTKLEDASLVIAGDVLSTIKRLSTGAAMDIIFVDPPYHLRLEQKILEEIQHANILAEDGYVIMEADKSTDFSFVDKIGFSVFREKTYKTNKHVFLELNE